MLSRRATLPVEWSGQVLSLVTRRAELPVEWTAATPTGGLVLGGGGPVYYAAEETYLSELEIRFEGDTLVRWSPVLPVKATKAPKPKPRRKVQPAVQAVMILDALSLSRAEFQVGGSTLVRWEPWLAVVEDEDEEAALYALMLR